MIIVPVLLLLIYLDLRIFFGVMIMVSFFSDILDGNVARRKNIVTDRGAQLDSIGDVITILTAVFGVVVFETEFILDHLALIIVVMSMFFLQLVISFIRYGKPSSFHTYLAKVTAVVQGLFMFWVFFFGVETYFFYLAVYLGIFELIEEIILVIMHKEWKTNVKGLYWVLRSK